MKIFRILLLLLIGFSQCLLSAEKEDAWRALSARCQNLHYQLLLLGQDNAPDPSMHEDDLKVIGKSLDALVKLRELKSKRIQLKPAKEIGEEKLQKLFSNVEAVGLTYGIFMAREMCDLGARLSFFTIAEDQQLKLHLRLPEKEMKEFEAALFKLGVVAEIKKPVEEPKK